MEEGKGLILDEAASRAPTNPVRITIREFISHWGAKRRGYRKVTQIRKDLKQRGLKTVPDFTSGWIDNTITILPVEADGDLLDPTAGALDQAVDGDAGEATGVALLIGDLESASGPLCHVPMDATLERAQALMMRNDYSQLAVMTDSRNLRGAITWQSIAQAKLRDVEASLRDCVVPAPTVEHQDPLLDHVPLIIDAGFAFVRGEDRSIIGIVTTADVSNQFARLANPFFLLGEIERRLRVILSDAFTDAEIEEMADPSDTSRTVGGVDDLSMGEYVRVFEKPDLWERIGLPTERKIFIEALNDVKEVRNDVMHFSPDPLESSQVDDLRNFLRWLKVVRPD